MARYTSCPNCHRKPKGGILGGAYINLHKCKEKGHLFCEECKNGDRCPICGSAKISRNAEKVYVEKN